MLTCEGWCTLKCKRVKDEPLEQNFNSPFSLLPALEDGYFSDITISAANGKEVSFILIFNNFFILLLQNFCI